jgi:hypothetical protein
MEWTQLRQTLTRLAPNDRQRAAFLGDVGWRTVQHWRHGQRIPKLLTVAAQHPALARAICADLLRAHDPASSIPPEETNDAL